MLRYYLEISLTLTKSDSRSAGFQPLLPLAIGGHFARSLAHYARSLARSGFCSKIAVRHRVGKFASLGSPPRPQTIAALLLRSFASPLANCARVSGRAGHPRPGKMQFSLETLSSGHPKQTISKVPAEFRSNSSKSSIHHTASTPFELNFFMFLVKMR